MTDHLLCCPFCGNDDFSKYNLRSIQVMETRKTTIYGIQIPPYTEYRVTCNRCGAKTGPGITGYNALTNKTTTDAEARQIAIDKWNRRQPNDHIKF